MGVEFDSACEPYRKCTRALSGLRDAQSVLEALQRIQAREPDALPETLAHDIRRRLLRRRDRLLRAEPPDRSALRRLLAQAERDAASWTLVASAEALGAGLRRTYQRGRRAMGRALARGRETDLHRWRRRARELALRQPMARDLRQVLSALRIGTEFERISDFAANIAKRALALGSAAAPELATEIQRLAAFAGNLLTQVVGAYRERDAKQAMMVWAQDEQLDEAYTLTYHRIVHWMQQDPNRVPAGTHLVFIAKNIERIGDHTTNIAEAIHFQVQGEWLSTPRPKGDTTSLEPIAAAPPG